MKESQSFRLLEELGSRLENLAKASRVKKGTLIEMCIETHLPELEKRYAKELAALASEIAPAPSPAKKIGGRKISYSEHAPKGNAMNDK